MFDDILNRLKQAQQGNIRGIQRGQDLPAGDFFLGNGGLAPLGPGGQPAGGIVPLGLAPPPGQAPQVQDMLNRNPGAAPQVTPMGMGQAPATPQMPTLPPVEPVKASSPFTMLPGASPYTFGKEYTDSRDGATIRPITGFNPLADLAPASMGPDGFTPGFGPAANGQRYYAADPAQYLINLQQAAQFAGVNPTFTAGQVLSGNQAGADASLKSQLAAQGLNSQQGLAGLDANTKLSLAGLGGQTQRDVAGIENSGRLDQAKLSAMGQLAGAMGQNPNMDPKLVQAVAGMIGSPGATPPIPAGAGVPVGGPVANPLAALAGDSDAIKPLLTGLGEPDKDGVLHVGPDKVVNLMNQLQGMPPERLQALVEKLRSAKGGDAILAGIAKYTAAANLQSQPPIGPDGKPIDLGSTVVPSGQIPGSYAIAGEGGRPIFTLGAAPRGLIGTTAGRGFGVLGAGSNPYNTMTLGNGRTIEVRPDELTNFWQQSPVFGRPPNPADAARHANMGNELLRLWQLQQGR